MKTNLFVLTLVTSWLFLAGSGCSKRFSDLPAFSSFPIIDAQNQSVGRFKTSYLADQIDAYYRGHTNGPIAIASFVDIDNLYGSSTFGRMLTEQLMSELAIKGYNVVEVRHAEAMQIMFGQGEFGLSQEIAALKSSRDLSGLVVGTYVVSPVRVYLNARLIDPSTSIIVSAGTVEMDKTNEIADMLRSSTLPPSLERIPVRHLGYASTPYPYYQEKWSHEEDLYPNNFQTNKQMNDIPLPKIQNSKEAPIAKLEPTT